jgi:hypothetical protein
VADEPGLVQRWQHRPLLQRVRLFDGLLLILAGIWLVVAGPLFHRLWLDIIGVILLILGGFLFSIGVKSLHASSRLSLR